MKKTIILICLLLIGCNPEFRSVADCRECNYDEFCSQEMNLFDYPQIVCRKYGEGYYNKSSDCDAIFEARCEDVNCYCD